MSHHVALRLEYKCHGRINTGGIIYTLICMFSCLKLIIYLFIQFSNLFIQGRW